MMNRFSCALLFAIALVCHAQVGNADEKYPWVPEHYSVPDYTLSPDGRYGVMLPDWEIVKSAETTWTNRLVEMSTGNVVAVLAGECGWEDPKHSMRYDPMKAVWSADGSTLCWIHPGRWSPDSYVMLKLREGKVASQMDLMNPMQAEILSRTEAAAPDQFMAAKLANTGWGSAYPEGFAIDVSIPAPGFSFPLVCEVTLNSFPNACEPWQIKVQASLTATITEDGRVSYSDFSVEKRDLSPWDMKKLAEPRESFPLIDTDIGKAILFKGMTSPDGRYAVGWTVSPAVKGMKPVEWSRWDENNPDKLLRNYDWQNYSRGDGLARPYEAVDFVIDLQSGKTVELSSRTPYWPGKRNEWTMTTVWIDRLDGNRCALIQNGDEGYRIGNFWLVTMDEKGMREVDMAPAMRKAVDDLLRERRPVVPDPSDYRVAYHLSAGKESGMWHRSEEVPFVAKPHISTMRGWGLKGVLTLRL